MKNLYRILLFSMLFMGWAVAKDFAELQEIYQNKSAEFEKNRREKISKLKKDYATALDKMLPMVQETGDLELVQTVMKEIARYKEEKKVPRELSELRQIKTLQQSFHKKVTDFHKEKTRKMAGLAKKYDEVLENLQRQLVRTNKLDEATAVRDERKQIEHLIARKPVPPKPPKPPVHVPRPEPPPPPVAQHPQRGTLYMTCDNSYRVWLNGKLLGADRNWEKLKSYPVTVGTGDVLAIEARDKGAGRKSTGLYACIVLHNGKSWGSSKDWKATTIKPAGAWEKTRKPLINARTLSTDNVHTTHKKPDPADKYNKSRLTGRFVWSANPSTNIYIREVIDLSKFEKR